MARQKMPIEEARRLLPPGVTTANQINRYLTTLITEMMEGRRSTAEVEHVCRAMKVLLHAREGKP